MAGSLVAPGLSDYRFWAVRNAVLTRRIANTSKRPVFSNCDDEWWLQARRLLGKRYDLSKRLSTDSYSAEDRFLSQRVIVRRLRPSSGPQDGRFLLALQSLASIRHPNFLNVIEVLCAGRIALFVTESPRGASIAETSEKRRFDLDDAMRLVPLTGFEFAAEHVLYPNDVSSRSLCVDLIGEHEENFDFERRPISAWPPFIVRLDISETARPRRRFRPPYLTDRREDENRWALRQTALFLSELLAVSQWPEIPPVSFRAPSLSLNNESKAILRMAACGTGPYENAEALLYALESIAKSPPTSRSPSNFISYRLKPVISLVRAHSFRPFESVSSALGRVPAALTRSIVLCALGATMFWLFSPPQHKVLSGRNPIHANSASVPLSTAQGSQAVQESVPIATEPTSDITAPRPDASPAPSPVQEADRSQNAAARLKGPSHHTLLASGGGRHLFANRARAGSRYRTFFRREIADFRGHLIWFWRRSPFSGKQHH
jgi:hypothetical protein